MTYLILYLSCYVEGVGGKWDQRGSSDAHGGQRHFIKGIHHWMIKTVDKNISSVRVVNGS